VARSSSKKSWSSRQSVPNGATVFKIPATRIAEELGKKMVVNIVMVGFFAAVTDVVDAQAVRKAVADSVPKGTVDVNSQGVRPRL